MIRCRGMQNKLARIMQQLLQRISDRGDNTSFKMFLLNTSRCSK